MCTGAPTSLTLAGQRHNQGLVQGTPWGQCTHISLSPETSLCCSCEQSPHPHPRSAMSWSCTL